MQLHNITSNFFMVERAPKAKVPSNSNCAPCGGSVFSAESGLPLPLKKGNVFRLIALCLPKYDDGVHGHINVF